MADELLDIVDEEGKVVSRAMKSEAHAKGLLHKTVIGCLKYGESWALVKQTPDRQDPGQLVAPVGGHVVAGEDVLDALRRESREEIGVDNITHNFVGKARFHRQVIGRDENHLMYVYEIETDEPIRLGTEAEAIEVFTVSEYKKMLAETPERIGNAHWFLLEHFYPALLPPAYKYVWRQPRPFPAPKQT